MGTVIVRVAWSENPPYPARLRFTEAMVEITRATKYKLNYLSENEMKIFL